MKKIISASRKTDIAVFILPLISILALLLMPLPALSQFNDTEPVPLIHQDRSNSKISKRPKKWGKSGRRGSSARKTHKKKNTGKPHNQPKFYQSGDWWGKKSLFISSLGNWNMLVGKFWAYPKLLINYEFKQA